MSIINDILNEEKNRLANLKNQLEKKIAELPKGSISKKKRSSGLFCYQAFREREKIIFKYIGKENSSKVIELNKKIQKRRKMKKMLKDINLNLKEVKRSLGEKQ